MRLNVTKIEFGGTSTVNKVTACAICNRFTDHATGPSVHIRLWMDTPRGADTHATVLLIHLSCLVEKLGLEKTK